ncbi:hypothetical protein [Variovorax brevis]|uniref:hypothetical protein n=1 Tax=Variovorax brevis TaxID=3053503 RepID=UPI004038040A
MTHFRAVLEQKHKLQQTRIDSAANSALACYAWPGNAREVRNVIESALLCADGVISAEHLPPELIVTPLPARSDEAPKATTDIEYERQLIIGMLRKYRKVNLVASALGIARSTLYRKFEVLGIEQREFADESPDLTV